MQSRTRTTLVGLLSAETSWTKVFLEDSLTGINAVADQDNVRCLKLWAEASSTDTFSSDVVSGVNNRGPGQRLLFDVVGKGFFNGHFFQRCRQRSDRLDRFLLSTPVLRHDPHSCIRFGSYLEDYRVNYSDNTAGLAPILDVLHKLDNTLILYNNWCISYKTLK